MDTSVEEILKTIGWDSGFYLPIASDENQVLERELALLVLRKTKATKDFEDVSQKHKNLEMHLKYVKQESQQNLAILSMYEEQHNAEKNTFKLALAENDSLNNEIKKMKKVFDDTNERVKIKKIELLRSIEKMEKIKAEASWDAEAMRAWEESLKNRDEDNEILKKFAMKDQKKAVDLEAKRQNLQVELTRKQVVMEKMVDDIINFEQIMERTGKSLKQSYEERCDLINQWQEAVRNLRQRDQDIKRVQNDIKNLNEAIKQNEIKLNEENAFLIREEKNNKIVEMQINDDNKYNSKIRCDLIQIMDDNSLWSNERASKKKIVEAMAHELKNLQRLNKDKKKQIANKEAQIKFLGNEMTNLELKLGNIKSKQLTNMERTKQLEEMINNANKITHDMSMDSKVVNNRIYMHQIKLNEVTDMINLKKGEILANENKISIIKRYKKRASKLLIHQKQRLSESEMKIACEEAKLANIEGQNLSEEDIETWNTKIKQLEENYAEHKEIKNLLNKQVLLLQKENVRLNNAIAVDIELRIGFKAEVQSLMLMSEGGAKQISARILKNQQTQVIENVLKLKVDKFEKAMSLEVKEIYNMQLYRVELISTLKERHLEIQTAKEMVLAKKRNLEEERGRLRADISLLNIKIRHLQSKFSLASTALGKDDLDQPLSMAHFRMKYAQEKYLMQQEGDELDQKVRKAEAEIIAMENTLKIVNLTNVDFKNNLLPIQGEEEAILNSLTNTLREQNAVLRETKKSFIAKLDSVKEMEEKLKELDNKHSDIREEYECRKDTLNKLEKEDTDRNDKISRTDRQINSNRKHISPKILEKYDKILNIRQLQDTNKETLHQMANFSLQNIETTPVINKYFNDYRLELPRVRTSLSTNSSPSIRSPSTPQSTSSSSSFIASNVTNIQFSFDEVKKTSKKF